MLNFITPKKMSPLFIGAFLTACAATAAKTDNPLLRLCAGLLCIMTLSFLAGVATERYQRPSMHPFDAFKTLLANSLSHSWEGVHYTECGLAGGMFSPLPKALNAANAYVIAKQGDLHSVVINLKNRSNQLVADLPCGFSNNGHSPYTLAFTQLIFNRMWAAKNSQRMPLTQADITSIVHRTQNEVLKNIELLPKVKIDRSFIETAVRILHEQDGLVLPDDVVANARQIHTESVDNGFRVYHRVLLTLDYTLLDELPTLTPERGKDITSSHWVDTNLIQFERDAAGNVVSGSVTIGRSQYPLKTLDKTAANLAWALRQAGISDEYPRPDYALAQTGMANNFRFH